MPPTKDDPPSFDAFLADLRRASREPDALRDSSALRTIQAAMRRLLHKGDPLREVMDSEDLAQDGSLLLVKNIGEFRGNSWGQLIEFAKANCNRAKIDAWREFTAQKRSPPGRTPVDGSIADPKTPTPSVIAVGREQLERLDRAINALDEKYREALRLRLDGMAYPVIAKRLEITEDTARQRVSRAVDGLQANRRRHQLPGD